MKKLCCILLLSSVAYAQSAGENLQNAAPEGTAYQAVQSPTASEPLPAQAPQKLKLPEFKIDLQKNPPVKFAQSTVCSIPLLQVNPPEDRDFKMKQTAPPQIDQKIIAKAPAPTCATTQPAVDVHPLKINPQPKK